MSGVEVAMGPVGFIGLGNMGGRMTRRLVDAGYTVIGHDPAAGRAEAAGAQSAASPAEVARRCQVVLLSLPDSGVVERVMRGEEGVLAGAMLAGPQATGGERPPEGTQATETAPASEGARSPQGAQSEGVRTVVDLSTASPESTVALAEEAARKGVTFLDAGITGGAKGAERGTLTVMAGGDAAAVDAIRPVLAAFSATVHHLGPTGAGHTAKLLNNFLNGVTLAATAEVMVAGRKAGLDLRTLLAAINAGSGRSFASSDRFPRIVEGDYLEGGLTGELMTKDIRLYVELAGRLGVPSLNSTGPLASFGAAAHLGYDQMISNRVVDAIGDLAGGVRIQQPGAGRTSAGQEQEEG